MNKKAQIFEAELIKGFFGFIISLGIIALASAFVFFKGLFFPNLSEASHLILSIIIMIAALAISAVIAKVTGN